MDIRINRYIHIEIGDSLLRYIFEALQDSTEKFTFEDFKKLIIDILEKSNITIRS